MTTANFREVCPEKLFPVLLVLENLSSETYLVGGAVRDLMSGNTPKDWDLVTDTPMDVLFEEFTRSGFSVKKTGTNFLVLNVYFGDFGVEVANFRKDKNCNGKGAQSVEVGTLDDDAHRRDFTVNALFVHTRTQEVLDPTGQGVEDLQNGVLRFVGSPKARIREDWLRAFRFMRFLNKGFAPEKNSLRAVRELWAEAYSSTTPERVRAELEKMVGVL